MPHFGEGPKTRLDELTAHKDYLAACKNILTRIKKRRTITSCQSHKS